MFKKQEEKSFLQINADWHQKPDPSSIFILHVPGGWTENQVAYTNLSWKANFEQKRLVAPMLVMIEEPLSLVGYSVEALTKKCIFYYAELVEGDDPTYLTGERWLEPIHTNPYDRESPVLGKPPEFCCEDMSKVISADSWGQTFKVRLGHAGFDRDTPSLIITGDYTHDRPETSLNCCPWCGAQVLILPNIKLKRTSNSEQRTVTETYSRYEEA